MLEQPLSKQEQKEFELEQKKKIVQTEHEFKQSKEIKLDKHFEKNNNIQEKNLATMKALEDGYGEAEIGRYLNVSSVLVSYVFRGFKR